MKYDPLENLTFVEKVCFNDTMACIRCVQQIKDIIDNENHKNFDIWRFPAMSDLNYIRFLMQCERYANTKGKTLVSPNKLYWFTKSIDSEIKEK